MPGRIRLVGEKVGHNEPWFFPFHPGNQQGVCQRSGFKKTGCLQSIPGPESRCSNG